jgi:isochorismate pyruvate lyase
MTFRTSGSAGELVAVAGMVGRDDAGNPIVGLVPQTKRALERIEVVLAERGLDRSHIIRLRVFLVDAAAWPEVLHIFKSWFGPTLPAATVIGGVTLVEPWMLIEIETDASGT